MILFAPLYGYVSDRFDRKKQVILFDLLCAAAVFAFYFLDLAGGGLAVYQIYICVFLLSMFQNFMSSSAMCLLQSSVDPADYTKQKSADTTISNLRGRLAPTANVVVFVALNLIIMIANSVLSVNFSARFQKIVPNEIMGRVGAFVYAVLAVCVPLGQVTAGLLMGNLPYFAVCFAEEAFSLIFFVLCFKNSRKPAIMKDMVPEEPSGENGAGE